jgi:hypothetical protein
MAMLSRTITGFLLKNRAPGLPPRRKLFITFGLQNCTKFSATFPILGIDFCAEWGANWQIGTVGA